MKKILIFGGAGFIGYHLANTALNKDYEVHVIDNLSRKGSEINLESLRLNDNAKRFSFHSADIRYWQRVYNIIKTHNDADVIVNLAAQVAVTQSIIDPIEDFQTNCVGNFNILESLRQNEFKGLFIYASTNKVYGNLDKSQINVYERKQIFQIGVSEDQPIDLLSPYGCSKGAADLYTLDYAKTYRLNTIVFRQSCIYGTHQYGIEDQGWISHFAIRACGGKPITIYGTGYQVRDVLYIDDLIGLYFAAIEHNSYNDLRGTAFNCGGGLENAITLVYMVDKMQKQIGKKIELTFSAPRKGDQIWYVSDNGKCRKILNWTPLINIDTGLSKMIEWIKKNISCNIDCK